MSKNTYTSAIDVHEIWANSDKNLFYSTVVIVEAEDMTAAENKVKEWFEQSDIENVVTHSVTIIKTLPKIH